MSEFKSRLKTKAHALYYAFNPEHVAVGPFPEVLSKWDELLANGRRVVAIGGSDAHEFPGSMGPLKRTLFPYEFHFHGINTHLFVPAPLVGDLGEDQRVILDALRQGRGFVGYDLPAPTRGFRFTAQGRDCSAWMGEELSAAGGVTLQVRLPRPVECQLVKDGKAIKVWKKRETWVHITTEPGVYRVEAFIDYMGQRRSWIYSNPIYVRP
jgi:hypothetical protein